MGRTFKHCKTFMYAIPVPTLNILRMTGVASKIVTSFADGVSTAASKTHRSMLEEKN